MLYQRGEKLKELKQTINDIPKLSGLKESDFVMSKKEIKKFEMPIRKLLGNLNNVLYSTLLSNDLTEDKRAAVYSAVEKVVLYLLEHFKSDLETYFYEEKLHIYENMFVFLVRDELCKRYKEYENILMAIPNAYNNLCRERESKFPRISHLIDIYNEISHDIANSDISDSTIQYLYHSRELILEEISELVKKECKEKFLCMDVLPNNLRHLIYLLKTELPLDDDNEETEE